MLNKVNNLDGANNSNTNQTQAERYAAHQELPEFFSLRLAFALKEAGLAFFEDLAQKLNQYQEDLMLTPRFNEQSEREEFLNIKWIVSEFADITVDYEETEINKMIKKESKILTNHFLRNQELAGLILESNQNPPQK